jgi:hypothetical protein
LVAIFSCFSFLMIAMLNPPLDRAAMGMVKEFFPASHLILVLWSGYGLVLIGTILGRGRQVENSDCRRTNDDRAQRPGCGHL